MEGYLQGGIRTGKQTFGLLKNGLFMGGSFTFYLNSIESE